jgi:Glycosyltransferase
VKLIEYLGLTRTSISPPTANLSEWYARASLTLVTSRLEVFSLVLGEGMLCGVVPLAYAADGPSFILQDFPDHLVRPGDREQLADRLVHFARMDDLEPLRERLRASIELRFTDQVVAQSWRDLLSPALPPEKRM